MNLHPLHRHLASSSLFAGVPEEQLAALEGGLSLVEIEPGSELMRQGEPGASMYVLVEGALDVHVRTPEGNRVAVDRLGPGAAVGEMALVVAQTRSATVTAAERSQLVELPRLAFERLAQDQPDLYETVVGHTTPRLQRVQLGHVLEGWFGALDARELRALQDAVEWIQLSAGETLYELGDAVDGMYLVVSGRLKVVRRVGDGREQALAEVGRGGALGEYGVFGAGTRAERAFALRDSHVVRVPRSVVESHPSIVLQTARSIVSRDGSHARPGQRARTFAVAGLGRDAPAALLADLLARQLEGWGSTVRLDAAAVDRAVGRSDAAQAEAGSVFDPSLTHWLNEQEAAHDAVVLVCDPGPALTQWTRRALRQCDVLLLVAQAGSDAAVEAFEREAAAIAGRTELVLVHPPDTSRPSGTARWLEPRPGTTVHHARLDRPADAGRLARRITGRAHGLVFSGGGARGYVHIGLIRAIQELRIPIDMVAGTSMGAVVGGTLALSDSYDTCYRAAASFGDPKKLLDRTLPIVALNRSRAVTETLHSVFGDANIEDLWTPFFCVSANLTRAEPVVHESGPLWKAVRASSAIPGVFTPLMHGGELLVDGGVMNNFPVDLMRERVGTGVVIGSNAYTQNAEPNEYDIGPSVSGWEILLQKVLPFRRKKRYPSMLGTLMRATSLSSKHLSEAALMLADLLVRYPTEAYGTLDFDRYEELIEMGYRVSHEALEEWLETNPGVLAGSRAA